MNARSILTVKKKKTKRPQNIRNSSGTKDLLNFSLLLRHTHLYIYKPHIAFYIVPSYKEKDFFPFVVG